MAYSKNRRLAEIVSDTSGNLSVEGIIVPTQSSSDNDTSAASTAFVHAHIDAVLDAAPGTLNTLNEIAAALNDDANFNTTVTNAIAAKLPLSGGTMTGNVGIGIAPRARLDLKQQTNRTSKTGTTRGVLHLQDGDTPANNELTAITFESNSNNASAIIGQSLTNNGSSLFFGTSNSYGSGVTNTAMSINHAGKVGIGTSSPSTLLHLGGTAPGDSIIRQDSTSSGTNWEIGERAAGKWQIFEDDGDKIVATFMSSGNVGIGTQSPAQLLEVSGNAGKSRFTRSGSAGTTMEFYAGASQSGGIQVQSTGLGISGTNGENHLFIAAGGNIGIGTTSPAGPLQVNGQTNIFNGQSGNIGGISIAPSNTDTLIINNSPGNYGDYGMRFKTMRTTGGAAYIDALYLKFNGNVGIRTTSPETELHVYGANNSAGDLYTQVGPGNIPSITIQNAGTTNNNNAAIYFRDDQDMRGSINMRFVNHSTHASELRFATTQANNTREKFVMTAAGQLGINKMSGFDTGGFGTPMLVIKQAVNSTWGGINVEANGNDSILSLSCVDSGATINTSYRTGAGHKPLTMMCAGQDGVQIGTSGNVRIGSGNVASNGATHQLHVDSGTIGYGIKIQSSSGYGLEGSNNGSYYHHSTDRAMYYWDKPGYFNGGAHTYSDSRLKENVVTITGALDSVAKMNGVTFTWINGDKRRGPDGKQFGVLAQNMLEVDSALPTLNVDPLETQDNIDDDSKDTDYYSMDYARLTPYFIEAIKELKTKLEAAEARITTLEG